jgi:hypothetical protein|tara:strand:- start:279 stop:1166 length:888 start_codon:yes stop_codon:yes gene_type:complete
MGSIVKSIGKAISKIGKGIKKMIKKIGPALLLAAAVYAGVAFMGAGGTAGGIGSLSPSNFMNGLNVIKDKVMGFITPSAGGAVQAAAGATQAAAGGAAAATQMAAGPMSYLQAGTAGATTAAATTASANVIPQFMSAAANPAMSTGDALIYMTKMNMLQTGVQMVAGFFDNTEEEQREHEKELLSMKYAYGSPTTDEQREWLESNPNWISQHPAQQQQQVNWGGTSPFQAAGMRMPSAPSPFVQGQKMGEPTFGRQGTRQFETTSPTALAARGPGMISQGTQQHQLPKRQPRRFA